MRFLYKLHITKKDLTIFSKNLTSMHFFFMTPTISSPQKNRINTLVYSKKQKNLSNAVIEEVMR